MIHQDWLTDEPDAGPLRSTCGADRCGNWIATYTGGRFYPLDPRADEVELVDIAHALSNVCRYTGHSRRFYSVAEHSLWVAALVANAGGNAHTIAWALLHDASEAYLCDLARPLKLMIPAYGDIETGVMMAVAARFGLSGIEPDLVKCADNAMLWHESNVLLSQPIDGGKWQVFADGFSLNPQGYILSGKLPDAFARSAKPETVEAMYYRATTYILSWAKRGN